VRRRYRTHLAGYNGYKVWMGTADGNSRWEQQMGTAALRERGVVRVKCGEVYKGLLSSSAVGVPSRQRQAKQQKERARGGGGGAHRWVALTPFDAHERRRDEAHARFILIFGAWAIRVAMVSAGSAGNGHERASLLLLDGENDEVATPRRTARGRWQRAPL